MAKPPIFRHQNRHLVSLAHRSFSNPDARNLPGAGNMGTFLAADSTAAPQHRLEHRLRSGTESPAFESHLSKFRKLIPALAAIFELLGDQDAGCIGPDAVALALEWSEYAEAHARRAYESANRPDTEAAGKSPDLLEAHLRAAPGGREICGNALNRNRQNRQNPILSVLSVPSGRVSPKSKGRLSAGPSLARNPVRVPRPTFLA